MQEVIKETKGRKTGVGKGDVCEAERCGRHTERGVEGRGMREKCGRGESYNQQ